MNTPQPVWPVLDRYVLEQLAATRQSQSSQTTNTTAAAAGLTDRPVFYTPSHLISLISRYMVDVYLNYITVQSRLLWCKWNVRRDIQIQTRFSYLLI